MIGVQLLSAFQRIGAALLSSLDLQEVLDILAEEILEAGVFRSLLVALVDRDAGEVSVVRSLTKYHGGTGVRARATIDYNRLNQHYPIDDRSILPEVARTGKLEVIEGWDDRFQEENRIGSFQNRISYFIPVGGEQGTLAVLATGSTIPEREDMLKRIESMQPLLDQVAIAIQHARVYSKLRLEIGERIASEERYKSLFENMQSGFALLEVIWRLGDAEDCRITEVNEAFCTLMSTNRDNLVGRTISESGWLPADEKAKWIRRIGEIAKTGAGVTADRYISPIQKYLSINAYRAGTNQVAVIAIDISEKTRLDEEMRKNRNLQSLGVLAGGIAHEFNNMLTGVIGGLSILKDGFSEGSSEREIAAMIEQSAKKSQTLTQQLITFSKGGRPVIELVSIEPLVRQAAGAAIGGNRIELTFSFPEVLDDMKVDPRQISQVVENLCRNAVEAMSASGTLDIVAEYAKVSSKDGLLLKDGRYLRISFIDQGSGIPEEIVKQVFDPYFSTKEMSQGLGLSIAHSIVQRHGGTIDVQSTEGQGTEVHVYLPARTG